MDKSLKLDKKKLKKSNYVYELIQNKILLMDYHFSDQIIR